MEKLWRFRVPDKADIAEDYGDFSCIKETR
jgi:hypothetical protein